MRARLSAILVAVILFPPFPSPCSVTPHQPVMAALATRWAEFYREFLSFEQCFHNLDIEMSNLNPFVTNMDVVKTQLEKLKV